MNTHESLPRYHYHLADIALTGQDELSAFRLSAHIGIPEEGENIILLAAVINNREYVLVLSGWVDGSVLETHQEFDSNSIPESLLVVLEKTRRAYDFFDLQKAPFFEWRDVSSEESVGDPLDSIPLSPHKAIEDFKSVITPTQ